MNRVMSRIRGLIDGIPGIRAVRHRLRPLHGLRYAFASRERVFTTIYLNNRWGDDQSSSGQGSSLEQTSRLRKHLPELWRRYSVRDILDAPCGDFYWMREVVGALDTYVGVDIVEAIIRENSRRYAGEHARFVCADLVEDPLPKAQLVLCRDCLVHLSFWDAARALANIHRAGAEYLLTTTFPNVRENRDIVTGSWRPINLELPPFGFPAPIEVFNEGCTQADGAFADKSMGLWRLVDLPLHDRAPKR
jgi:SAM-dependent methyltransferase